MSKLPNYYKEESLFYLNDKNRMNYNALCKKCKNNCKQSFRVCVLRCDKYISKRSVGWENTTNHAGGKKIYVKVTALNAYDKASAASFVKNVTVKK